MRRRSRGAHPSAERTLSLAAQDEVRELVGVVEIRVYANGPVEVLDGGPDEEEWEAVMLRALWALGDVAGQLGMFDEGDE